MATHGNGPSESLAARLRRHARIAASVGADSCYLLDEAADEIKRLQADAARYRWLRKRAYVQAQVSEMAGFGLGQDAPADYWDKQIDAAMQADQPPNAALSGPAPAAE